MLKSGRIQTREYFKGVWKDADVCCTDQFTSTIPGIVKTSKLNPPTDIQSIKYTIYHLPDSRSATLEAALVILQEIPVAILGNVGDIYYKLNSLHSCFHDDSIAESGHLVVWQHNKILPVTYLATL